MKNTEALPGWKNRHTDGLPVTGKIIKTKIVDIEGETDCFCEWFSSKDTSQGYLGTAIKLQTPHKGIGFHAWEQNNAEFVYYQDNY